MHGQHKLATEGYRTRDGHLIEWFGRLLDRQPGVQVVSRPDPILLKRRYDRSRVAPNTDPVDTYTLALPDPTNRKKWWWTSSKHYPIRRLSRPEAIVSWNPFVFEAPSFDKFSLGLPIALDLLDDWSIHHAFSGISTQVEEAYKHAFRRADRVYANSEGTAQLAQRFGRNDVVMLPNGVDRDRFHATSRATGPITVGYLGKIGKRVDLDLVLRTATAFPTWNFVFAGPIIDAEYRRPLQSCKNITLLGDVEYPEVPSLLQAFDIGWVPHSVGRGEVGGDAIKIYEYNAAGLPVLSTPIIGAGKRGLDDVHVLPADQHVDMLKTLVGDATRVHRVDPSLPTETSWEHKAQLILSELGIPMTPPQSRRPLI